MNNEILKKMNECFNKVSFTAKKLGPEIMVIGGVVGVVGSTVMACRATTKINPILKEMKNDIDAVHTAMETEGVKEKYSQEDANKAMGIIYAQAGIKLIKLYGPSVALGVLSITSILAGNNILRKRNVALAAAYTAVDKSFKEYRNRVVEKLGDEAEKKLRFGSVSKKFEEILVDEKTGKEKKKEVDVDVVGLDGISEYARFFDASSPYYEKNSEYNLTFLRAQQQYANDLLCSKGCLFLNDVYKMLGIQETKAGQVVGWVYDQNNTMGDNYVDFGLYDVNREKTRDFINGYEKVILLDFNVDGNIWDLM